MTRPRLATKTSEIEGRTAAPRTRAWEQLPAEGWEALGDRLASEAAARSV